ncbi:unnamed protein product, partial [Sphacelaria rigidula]
KHLLRTLVHVSTAFVHGRNSGTPSSPLPQRLPDLGGRDPGKLYRSAQIATSKDEGRQSSGGAGAKGKGGRSDATNALKDLGYPNTYTFTKAIGEHLLARARRCGGVRGLKLRVVRPSIVGPSWVFPWAGWTGEQPSTV